MNWLRGLRPFTRSLPAAVFSLKVIFSLLLNEGAAREDIAASIFQSVVNQTISGLACGKPIRGRVAFLGRSAPLLAPAEAAFYRDSAFD